MANKLSVDRKFLYKDFKKSNLQTRLARVLRICENSKIPVLILIDGWESSGRGKIASDISKELNPKYTDVDVLKRNENEGDYDFIIKAFKDIPAKSHLKVFAHSYYYELFDNIDLSYEKLEGKIEELKNFEKMLYDDKTIIIKIFLNIDKDVLEKRIEEIKTSVKKPFYHSKLDKLEIKRYEDYENHFDNMIKLTSFDFSTWEIIDSNNLKDASKEVMGIIIDKLSIGIERVLNQEKDKDRTKRSYDKEVKIIENLDLSKKLSKKEYKEKKKQLQKEVSDCFYKLYNKGVSQVLVFEGVDAAGKDGAIKRLIKKVDPRLYRVHAISAPNQAENARHYLWRFYDKLPKKGFASIFSRSWYGRVMVERVENFAKIAEWDRAYEEMVNFEKGLSKNKMLVLKFFVVIDKNVQLERFKDREKEPDKQYKITDEDWRNRQKWDMYIKAMNEMLDRTDSEFAPWIIVEGNDKKYARIKVMEEYLKYAEKFL